MHIGGDLIAPPTAPATPLWVTVDGKSLNQPVSVKAPCACDANKMLDVAAIIAEGKAHNDNAQSGFDPASLNGGLSGSTMELPAGRVFASRINAVGQLTLVVNQKTSLFVEGDVNATGGFNLELGPQGELDMFIGGNLSLTGNTALGDPNRPDRVLVYVAGDQQIALAGVTVFAGNLYAPRATVALGGVTTYYGAMFAGNIGVGGGTVIHYDSAIVRKGDACPPPAQCNACDDCKATAACVAGSCGPCQSDADCCEPLVCVAGKCSAKIF
jgi:hypothetical protein